MVRAWSIRKKSCRCCRGGMEMSSNSKVRECWSRKECIAGSHFMGYRCGSGVDTSLKTDFWVPAKNCIHDTVIRENVWVIPGVQRVMIKCCNWEISFSTLKPLNSIPANFAPVYTTGSGVFLLNPYLSSTAVWPVTTSRIFFLGILSGGTVKCCIDYFLLSYIFTYSKFDSVMKKKWPIILKFQDVRSFLFSRVRLD